MMRRFAGIVLASLIVLLAAATATAAASLPAAQQRLKDPETGKIVLFGCPQAPFMKRIGTGMPARFEALAGPGAVRGRSYETFQSPVTDGQTGVAYRGVLVGVQFGRLPFWLAERCFHLPVPGATVICASRVWDDDAGTRESGNGVVPGQMVYPAMPQSSGDYDYVYTARPGIEGYVAHRCLRYGSPSMRAAPNFGLPVATPTPH